jgi:hypothetical protein
MSSMYHVASVVRVVPAGRDHHDAGAMISMQRYGR